MGLKTVCNEHGTEILNAIAQNNLTTLKAILDKRLKADSKKIRELFESDIQHKPTKTVACPLMLAVRLRDSTILRYVNALTHLLTILREIILVQTSHLMCEWRHE